MTPEELAKKKAAEEAAKKTKAKADDDDADDEAAEDETIIPSDPVELAAFAKKTAADLRKAQREMAKAGLTKKEERRLTDLMATMEVKLDKALEALALNAAEEAEEEPPVPGPDPKPEPAKPVDDDDDCWATIL